MATTTFDPARVGWPLADLFQTLSGENFTMDVKASDTIRSVKTKIQEIKCNTPVHQQRLLFAEQALDDFRKLSDYNIPRRAKLTLVLVSSIQIFIKFRDVPHYALEIEGSDTIEDLKSVICARDDLVNGYCCKIQKQHLQLCLDTRVLDDHRTLSSYNIAFDHVVQAWIPLGTYGRRDTARPCT